MTQPHSPFGHPQGQMVNGVWTRAPKTIASKAALKAIPPAEALRTEGQSVALGADYSAWIFHPTTVAADPTEQLVLVPDDGGPGRWLRADAVVDLSFAITWETPDGAPLFAVPSGCVLFARAGYWQVDFGFSGGAASAIGLSSTNPAYATKGDLLGGAAGDLAAALSWGRYRPATPGAKASSGIYLVAGNVVRLDRITPGFAAGTGRAHLICDVLQNLGV